MSVPENSSKRENYTERQILQHAGRISHEMAIARAHEEYEKFQVKQDREYLSDFDHAFAQYLKGGRRGMKLHFESSLEILITLATRSWSL